MQSLKLIREFKPDVVFIKGGFVGLPVGLAAGWLKVPYVIHESDLVPGLTNRRLAKKAAAIAVGFPVDKYQAFPTDKLVFTGIPIRPAVLKAHRLEGLSKFKLDPDLPVLLVTGGSQGASSINQAVLAALPELLAFCQVIHLVGEREIEQVRFETAKLKPNMASRYQAHSFLMDDMPAALAAADVVVSRAGAQTIAELAALSKPTILIPNNAMAGHQLLNAQVLSRQGAVRVIQEDKLGPAVLVREVSKVLTDSEEQARLAAGIHQLAAPNADKRLAELIVEVGQKGEHAD